MKRKVIAAVLLVTCVVTIANWLDYAFFSWRAYGYPVPSLLWVALIGCCGLVLACLAVFYKHRYGVFLGLGAACLLWPYFGMLAWSLPWRDFGWLLRIHDHGASEAAALFMLLAVTIYSIVELRPSVQSAAGAN
jgi:hypothetical protein